MTIKSSLKWRGDRYELEYNDADDFSGLPYLDCQQVYGVCFCGDQMVIVRGESGEDGLGWGLVGGHKEDGEKFEETLKREVEEETNMRVIEFKAIGYQKVTAPDGSEKYQLRYVTKVEKIGEFEKDIGGSVVEVKLINPEDYRKYFDWGEIGERIVSRAMELKETL